jgi:hypothetical protein
MCFSSKSSGSATAKPPARVEPVDPNSTPAANSSKPNPTVLSSTGPTDTTTDPLGQSQLGG